VYVVPVSFVNAPEPGDVKAAVVAAVADDITVL
jgi:hypothetical protein